MLKGLFHWCVRQGYYVSAGVRSGALPHVVAANMGHGSFAVTARHYAQPQAIAEAHSARVAKMLDLEHSPDAFSHLPAEQLIAKLPAATLARLAELVNERTAPMHTRAPEGAASPTEFHT